MSVICRDIPDGHVADARPRVEPGANHVSLGHIRGQEGADQGGGEEVAPAGAVVGHPRLVAEDAEEGRAPSLLRSAAQLSTAVYGRWISGDQFLAYAWRLLCLARPSAKAGGGAGAARTRCLTYANGRQAR
jgi:hypothetical protein